MDEATSDTTSEGIATEPVRRSWLARIGVAALNLIAPGLGLVRIGRWRAGLLAVILPGLIILGLAAIGAAAPPTGFYAFAAVVGLLLVGSAVLYGLTLTMTWRGSGVVNAPHWWSRWYALIALWLVVALFDNGAIALMHRVYKVYYAPSASMAPTIAQNDRFLVDMQDRQSPRRGDVIVFKANGIARVARVAAVGGDVIALRAGVPIINGHAARQVPESATTIDDSGIPQRARILREQLPGDSRDHRLLDIGTFDFDDVAPVRVPKGALYVLGDNRDRSADSRVPLDELGAGMVPENAILGRALFLFWGRSGDRSGAKLN
jgi:signal peptidase I